VRGDEGGLARDRLDDGQVVRLDEEPESVLGQRVVDAPPGDDERPFGPA
jgi:hypothetical protein